MIQKVGLEIFQNFRKIFKRFKVKCIVVYLYGSVYRTIYVPSKWTCCTVRIRRPRLPICQRDYRTAFLRVIAPSSGGGSRTNQARMLNLTKCSWKTHAVFLWKRCPQITPVYRCRGAATGHEVTRNLRSVQSTVRWAVPTFPAPWYRSRDWLSRPLPLWRVRHS